MEFPLPDITRAFQNDEFVPYFQPLAELRTGEPKGFEILARWNHPERGFVFPDHFISQAEKQGWIDSLTRVLLQQSFIAMEQYNLPSNCSLSINLSPVQLHDRSLPRQIEKVATEGKFPLQRLTIEITETALLDDIEDARAIAMELKELGCRIALDDFGTGYSGLSHLQALPFDELKVDRSFVCSMTTKPESRKIVSAVVGLGQSLGMITVAEGVETPAQAEMLARLNCDLAQGWLYSKAVPASALETLLSSPWQGFRTNPYDHITGRVSYISMEGLPSQRLAQLQAVYDGSPVGLAFIDKNLHYKNINRKLATMNGRSLEDHLSSTVPEMVPNVYPLVKSYFDRALGGESIERVEISVPATDSTPKRTLLNSYEPAFDETGEVLGFCVAVMDISQLKLVEERWQESKENFRQLLELLPQIPWVIDPEGRALDVSRRWLDLSGMSEGEWQGFGWLNALHPDDRETTISTIHESLKTLQPISVKYRLRAKGEDWKWMLSRGSARLDAHGNVLCWYGCLEELDPHPAPPAS